MHSKIQLSSQNTDELHILILLWILHPDNFKHINRNIFEVTLQDALKCLNIFWPKRKIWCTFIIQTVLKDGPEIVHQNFPQLCSIDTTNLHCSTFNSWAENLIQIHGEWHTLP